MGTFHHGNFCHRDDCGKQWLRSRRGLRSPPLLWQRRWCCELRFALPRGTRSLAQSVILFFPAVKARAKRNSFHIRESTALHTCSDDADFQLFSTRRPPLGSRLAYRFTPAAYRILAFARSRRSNRMLGEETKYFFWAAGRLTGLRLRPTGTRALARSRRSKRTFTDEKK